MSDENPDREDVMDATDEERKARREEGWEPPERVTVYVTGEHYTLVDLVGSAPVPYVPEEVATRLHSQLTDVEDALERAQSRLAAVERERDEAFALVASTAAENKRLMAIRDKFREPADLRARVEELEAGLREIREPIEDTYNDSGNWSDLRIVLRYIDALLAGGSREEPRSDTTCKHLINCGEGCGCDEPEPRPDTRGPFLPGKWKLGVQAARERAEEDERLGIRHRRESRPDTGETCPECGWLRRDGHHPGASCYVGRPGHMPRPDTTKEDR